MVPAVPRLTSKTHRLELGARIKELREERGLTQEQLAERADRHRAYVGGVERGERNPTLDVIHSIAMGLDVEIADLFAPRRGQRSGRDVAAEGPEGFAHS